LAACAALRAPTGIALILVGGDGENVIAVIRRRQRKGNGQDARDAVAAMSPG
jgi:ribokinase